MTYSNILAVFLICKSSNTICFPLTLPEEFRVVKNVKRLIMYEWMNYLLCMSAKNIQYFYIISQGICLINVNSRYNNNTRAVDVRSAQLYVLRHWLNYCLFNIDIYQTIQTRSWWRHKRLRKSRRPSIAWIFINHR